jgi:hypothetical protein
MSKKIMVNRKEFEKNFLEAIKSFVPKCEFFPIYMIRGKLVTFCANRQENGTLALYLEHTPLHHNLDEGDVIYIKDPQKLLSAVKMLSDERILLKIIDHQIVCKTDDFQFTFTLYDPILAKRDKTFWKPEKFNSIKKSFKVGVLLEKDLIAKIKTACNVVDIDTVTIENKDDEMLLTVGSSKANSVSTKLPYIDHFSEHSKFIKNIFHYVGKSDATLYETEDEKVIGFREENETNVKYYIVTKTKNA